MCVLEIISFIKWNDSYVTVVDSFKTPNNSLAIHDQCEFKEN